MENCKEIYNNIKMLKTFYTKFKKKGVYRLFQLIIFESCWRSRVGARVFEQSMSDACNSVDDLPLDDSETNKEIHDWLDKVGQFFRQWEKMTYNRCS